MSKSNTFSKQSNVQEIHQEQWITFLAEFTRENRGAHARLEIIGSDSDVGLQVETEDRPFDGVSADIKDGERTVWITYGSTTTDHLSHSVHGAVAIRTLPLTEHSGAVLEIESADGTKNILYLTAPEAYALPPSS
jgi:hypothetical protein